MLKLKRRNKKLRLGEDISGTRFPMNLAPREARYRWNNPRIYQVRDPRTGRYPVPFSVRGTYGYRFLDAFLNEDAGNTPKRIHRGCIDAGRIKLKHNPMANLNYMRGISCA